MRYRKLDKNGDYTFGHGNSDFFQDVPEAPAQAALTRLQLFLGTWFLDTSDGTPWKTKVLGTRTVDTRDPVIRARVLKSRGIKSISSYSSNLNRDTQRFDVAMTLDTIYGAVKVQGTI